MVYDWRRRIPHNYGGLGEMPVITGNLQSGYTAHCMEVDTELCFLWNDCVLIVGIATWIDDRSRYRGF
jgi:hypothetical protein